MNNTTQPPGAMTPKKKCPKCGRPLWTLADAFKLTSNEEYLYGRIGALETDLSAARERVKELEENGRLLDWLEANPIHEWGFGQFPGCITMNGEQFFSVRDAIRSAMGDGS